MTWAILVWGKVVTATFNISEARAQFSRLVQRAMNGETIVIAKASIPVAMLKAFDPAAVDRQPGYFTGAIVIHDDFDDPQPEFDSG